MIISLAFQSRVNFSHMAYKVNNDYFLSWDILNLHILKGKYDKILW